MLVFFFFFFPLFFWLLLLFDKWDLQEVSPSHLAMTMKDV